MSKIVKINQNKRREPIKDEDLQDFEPYCVPDMERLRKLLLEGKGAERTWREYAEAMGSWSTYAPKFSRIRKSNLVRPVDKDFLRKIVDNAADFIGLDDIMRAGGWQRKKKPVEKGSFDEYIRNEWRESTNKERRVKNIITFELLQRGYAIKDMRAGELREEGDPSGVGLSAYEGGLLFSLSVEKDDEKFNWAFIGCLDTWGEREYQEEEVRSKRRMGRMLSNYAALFLKDAWEPETVNDRVRYSMVFVDPNEYKTCWNRFKEAGIKVNNTFSLMMVEMIDEVSGRVKEEFMPRNDGRKIRSPFDEGLLDDDKDEEDDMR